MTGILSLATLIIMGTMLANALAKPQGTAAIFNGIGGLWKAGINGVLGVHS